VTQERQSLLSDRQVGGGEGNLKCELFNLILLIDIALKKRKFH
jgi:hypothetical protein